MKNSWPTHFSQGLFSQLYAQGIQLITRLKSNMKNMLMDTVDRLVLCKRGIIESVNCKLKLGSVPKRSTIAKYTLSSPFQNSFAHSFRISFLFSYNV